MGLVSNVGCVPWLGVLHLLDLGMVMLTHMVVESRVSVTDRGSEGLANGEGGQHQSLHCAVHV